MYRKIIPAAAVLLLTAFQARAATLPEINGWTNGELRETKLETISGNHGDWQEREYRTSGGAKFLAVWMEGAGPKLWRRTAETGEARGEESAKTVAVAGRDATLESRPVLGLSLVVKVGTDGVLTLESQSVNEDELTEAAEILISALENREETPR